MKNNSNALNVIKVSAVESLEKKFNLILNFIMGQFLNVILPVNL